MLGKKADPGRKRGCQELAEGTEDKEGISGKYANAGT